MGRQRPAAGGGGFGPRCGALSHLVPRSTADQARPTNPRRATVPQGACRCRARVFVSRPLLWSAPSRTIARSHAVRPGSRRRIATHRTRRSSRCRGGHDRSTARPGELMTTRMVRVLIASALASPLIDRIRAVDRRLDVIYRADLVGQPRYPCDHTAPVTRTPAQAAEWAALVAEAEVMFDVDRASDRDLAQPGAPAPLGAALELRRAPRRRADGARRPSDRRDQCGGGARHAARRVRPVRDALLREAHAARPRRSAAPSLGTVRPRHASRQDARHRGIRPCGPGDRATRPIGGTPDPGRQADVHRPLRIARCRRGLSSGGPPDPAARERLRRPDRTPHTRDDGSPRARPTSPR